MCVFFAYLYGPRKHFSCFMLSSSISGSQMAKFENNYIFEKKPTFVGLVKKTENGVKTTAVSFFNRCL